ncbi:MULTISPECIES: flavin reductase family protein [Paraburkholderia]|uniref:flavin reductase family protein n=1 Tax=Paraburkholderia TaxID=1822464 RepID=UPI0022516403|nr:MULTISPECIES: flavin reductase family protein [Paraburkholderia]MCX4163597.1 flavin reductase family protein [Paraburkholderia megapolitana]MDN7159092.1 flavin reductase family protein [Paraburkholderia sp. CHISQ3]MDQ6496139.1 flavin reductase family protein [Paraburkholderia megapolitana]
MTDTNRPSDARARDADPAGVVFRHALGHFATGITVISTVDAQGTPYGATVSSFASLSLDPPLIQWSLTTTSYSYPIFSQAKHFAVNILASDQEDVSRIFSKPVDRFAQIESLVGLEGLPLVAGCVGWIECGVEREIEAGDHTIFVGRVMRARIANKSPLIHWRGCYHSLEADAVS